MSESMIHIATKLIKYGACQCHIARVVRTNQNSVLLNNYLLNIEIIDYFIKIIDYLSTLTACYFQECVIN